MSLKHLFKESNQRSKTYYILDNIFSAVTHGIGFSLAIAGLVILIVKAAQTGSAIRIVSFTLYGASLVLLYLFSTLYHSLIFTRANKVFQIFDHSSIFILIVGSYMPYTLVTIGGKKGWWMFGLILAMAIIGILYYILIPGNHVIVNTIIYIGMGWLVVIALNTLYLALGKIGFWLLVLGGVSYTIGAILYCLRRIPFIHVIWHLFVMLGSILMYFSILLYV
ncbi:PAQR family membrane homeostasis protein TrhA [Lactobacillus sp. PV034]|uniref:PAQR family membrane homeostasis protein TrhA n=1 Tax=Lactobacillus sp. PV034 TaxID=2594495 RepID=UPI00223F1504|nr:hemolysin III family protein [Lactobacillus sp. PV034]QNQ80478.1 hemolysin III family protein [Lactobacillus sp. PV034]